MVRLTPDRLDALGRAGVPCHTCVRWELDPVRRARLDRTADPLAGAAAEKEAWLSHVLREWGSCGRVALVDDVPVGYVVYAPPAFVPGADAHPTAPKARRAAGRDGAVSRRICQASASMETSPATVTTSRLA